MTHAVFSPVAKSLVRDSAVQEFVFCSVAGSPGWWSQAPASRMPQFLNFCFSCRLCQVWMWHKCNRCCVSY